MGGRGGSSARGGGTFGGLEIERDGQDRIEYEYYYRDKNGHSRVGEVTGRYENEALREVRKKKQVPGKNTLLPKNFFEKAREVYKEKNGDKSIWEEAQKAYQKALRREERRKG